MLDNKEIIDEERVEVKPPLDSSIENRLRVLANLIIDRILEEKRNGTLKLKE